MTDAYSFVKAQYDCIGETYEKSKQLPLARFVERPSVSRLLGDIQGRNVLDLACGSGFYTRLARRMGASRVTGVDVSAEMVGVAERIEEQEPLGIGYRVGDAMALPSLGAFDTVMAIYLLNYADSQEAMQAMARTAAANLRPGGTFLSFNARPDLDLDGASLSRYGFSFDRAEPLRTGTRIRVSVATVPPFDFHACLQHASVYEEAFTAAGFEDFVWTPTELSFDGILEFGTPYWQSYFDNPPWVSFRCRRSAEVG
ncbi:class I SAM-dependent methyltransferase [Streptomyces sp. NPDC021212]|uniref:class I SAM-dependent methyltransferase n=1 Tax=Streptomyces sp. NPDC021212 TaxID=3365118 RepID=UPI0037BCF9B2